MTQRVRIIGYVAAMAVMWAAFILLKKRLNWKNTLIGTGAALLVGGRRLYLYYFSEMAARAARGQFAQNSLKIAAKNFPFGTGFGTFGSRVAQMH